MIIAEIKTVEVSAGQVWAHKRTGRKLTILGHYDCISSEVQYDDKYRSVVVSDGVIISEFNLVSPGKGGIVLAAGR